MPSGLDDRLLAAHAAGDERMLSALYAEAADRAFAEGREDAGAFYLTHAYVFALSSGSRGAGELNRRLAALGRDELQNDL